MDGSIVLFDNALYTETARGFSLLPFFSHDSHGSREPLFLLTSLQKTPLLPSGAGGHRFSSQEKEHSEILERRDAESVGGLAMSIAHTVIKQKSALLPKIPEEQEENIKQSVRGVPTYSGYSGEILAMHSCRLNRTPIIFSDGMEINASFK